MHIAYVNQDKGIRPSKRKGARVHVESMVEAFESLGVRVTLVEEHENSRVAQALEAANSKDPLALVYERYSLAATAGARFSQATNLPHIVEVNAPLIDEERAHRGEPAADTVAQERFVFGGATRVFAVSSQVAEYVKAAGASQDKVRVTPNAVDANRFRPRRGLRSVVPDERVVLGFHGRLRPWHGFDRWLQAAAGLVRAGHDIHVLTVGEGDFETLLRAALEPDRFTSLGWQSHSDVAESVACFDILPLSYSPSAPCYFSPLKLLEGMACGAVPVVPELGDLPDVVQDEVNGLVYDPEREDGLQSALERVVVDEELRQRLGRRAHETASEHSWVSIARQALEVKREVRVS